MTKNLTPERRREKNARYRANRAAREADSAAPDRPPESTEGEEHEARRKAEELGLYGSPTTGVLAQPWEPWAHLRALQPGERRRSVDPVEVRVLPSFWFSWIKTHKRHARTAVRGFTSKAA